MTSDRAPFVSHLFAAAACASAGVAGGAGSLMHAGAAALIVWAVLERLVEARVPRALARAVDLAVASTIVFLLLVRPGGMPEALRLTGPALAVAQLSRVLRRKHRGDVMAMHGIAVLHLVIGAFLTREASWLPWLAACAVFGTAASVRLVTRSAGSSGEPRVIVAAGAPPGWAWSGLAQGGALVLSLTVLSAVVFILLPRSRAFDSGASPAMRPEEPDPTDYSRDVEDGAFRITGFSSRVRLGDVGRIKQAPWPAFVVQVTEGGAGPVFLAPGDLYFRGRVLDDFDGREWSSAVREEPLSESPDLPRRLAANGGSDSPRVGVKLMQEYVLRPSGSDVLFLLDVPDWIQLDQGLPRVIALGDGTFRAPSPHRAGLSYRAESRLPGSGEQVFAAWPSPNRACRALPPVSERLFAAARAAAGEGEPESRARRIADWVRSRCEYTLAFAAAPGPRPVEDFLFVTRAGHCEYFAAAVALLLRAAGIPSRLVVGYRGGQWLEDEEAYLLRQSDAHAWVEAFIVERGWIRLDATPGDDRAVRVPPSRLPGAVPEATDAALDLVALVRRFGPEERARVLREARRVLAFVAREGLGIGRPPRRFPPPVVVVGGLLLAFLGARALRRRQSLRVAASASRRGREIEAGFYREALRHLRRRGLARRPTLTPREFEGEVRGHLGEEAELFRGITIAFEGLRYGRRSEGKEALAALRAKSRSLAR